MTSFDKFIKISIPLSIIIAGAAIAIGLAVGLGGKSTTAKAPSEKEVTKELITLAAKVGANKDEFKTCLEENDTTRLQKDFEDGSKVGVDGTPHTVVVFKDGSKVAVGGAQTIEAFRTIIDTGRAPAGSPAITMRPIDQTDYVLGSRDAEIFLVEYSDYDCPFCQQLHPTLEKLVEEYNGKVAWVYRQFLVHQSAVIDAIAADCVGKLEGNDAFWEYSAKLFENQ